MTKIKMPAGKAGTVETYDHIVTSRLSTSLAITKRVFNRNSSYCQIASTRRIRRMLERAAKKAGARHG